MICHRHKCIFIHIPKTAGKSIQKIFEQDLGDVRGKNTPLYPYNGHKHESKKSPPHLKACEYVQYGHLSQEEFDTYFKFAFVRNPWARMVSEYKYRNHPRKYDFKRFLFKYFPEPSLSDAYIHVIPQYYFLHDDNGKLLVDMVCKFETLQRDFDVVCKKIGFPISHLPHRNKSLTYNIPRSMSELQNIVLNGISTKVKRNTHSHSRDYYDEETIAFVAEHYKMDIEAFGYSF